MALDLASVPVGSIVVITGVPSNIGAVRSPPESIGIVSVSPAIIVTMAVMTGPIYSMPVAGVEIVWVLVLLESD